MNWITTNIRLPEDVYMELKLKAARERKSVAAVIREKLEGDTTAEEEKANDLLDRLKTLGKEIAKQSKGLNLTQAVIDARYNQ